MITLNHFLGIDPVPDDIANLYSRNKTVDWETIMLALLCDHAGVDTYEWLDRMNPATVMMHIICASEGDA